MVKEHYSAVLGDFREKSKFHEIRDLLSHEKNKYLRSGFSKTHTTTQRMHSSIGLKLI